MNVYLSQFIGLGTHADPYRPAGFDQASEFSCIDLRQDATQPGPCLFACEENVSHPQCILIGTDITDSLSAALRNQIDVKLGVNAKNTTSLREYITNLLLTDYGKWKPVMADRNGIKEIWLGGMQWIERIIP